MENDRCIRGTRRKEKGGVRVCGEARQAEERLAASGTSVTDFPLVSGTQQTRRSACVRMRRDSAPVPTRRLGEDVAAGANQSGSAEGSGGGREALERSHN
jgi:hypothetical protein